MSLVRTDLVWSGRSLVVTVFPELDGLYQRYSRLSSGCSSCSKRRYAADILHVMLQLPLNGRNVDALSRLFPKPFMDVLKAGGFNAGDAVS